MISFKSMKVSFCWEDMGLITICSDWKKSNKRWVFHLVPKDEYCFWGKRKSYYDGTVKEYGVGPLCTFSIHLD